MTTSAGGAAARRKITLRLVVLAGVLASGTDVAAFQAQAEEAGKATTQRTERQRPTDEKLPRTDLHGDPLPEFSQRQAASKQLSSVADRAGPALRAALKADLSAEQRQRIEEALATLTDVPSDLPRLKHH
jgi:hypothetical protein